MEVSKQARSGFTLRVNPCVVIHRELEIPTAAILLVLLADIIHYALNIHSIILKEAPKYIYFIVSN